MQENVLITGGTGLVGTLLTQLLQTKGYTVSYLSRSSGKKGNITKYGWDLASGKIDQEAIEKADHIVHLAGASVAEKRWTDQRKKEILDSRVDSSRLLIQTIEQAQSKPKTFVAASAVGIYGTEATEIRDENSPIGNDFLAEVTKQWEHETSKAESLGLRSIQLRIGVVLSDKGGALTQMAAPVKYCVGAPLGSGKQNIPWIHIQDLCRMVIFSIEHPEVHGVYNAVTGNVTNETLTKAIAKALNKPLWLPKVPEFVLSIALGEMGSIVTKGVEVSNQKIKDSGFTFTFTSLEDTLGDLLG